ncbi:MAG: nuclear transport factor 2 family protein [Sphingobacteriales bacterium]|nr:MAG: nuclear transport factor 2 family protein [Sphingobacteriales bacterium]
MPESVNPRVITDTRPGSSSISNAFIIQELQRHKTMFLPYCFLQYDKYSVNFSLSCKIIRLKMRSCIYLHLLYIMIRNAFLLFLLLTASSVNAQSVSKKKASKTLYSTVLAMDKQVFDAYNKCDLDKFEEYFTRDVEFFNDRTGYTESRHDLMKTMKDLCESGGMQRVLVNAQVYPLDFYGAVETGTHRFYKTVNGKRRFISSARFTNIWKQEDGEWKIARVISYDHKGE